MDFSNSTDLDDSRLLKLFRAGIGGWSVGRPTVRVRYSRGADFSGTCFYADQRIFVNLGRHLRYPYRMRTLIARGKTANGVWRKPAFTIELADGYQVVLFVFMHELYHLLVKRARRNVRQKETMCDRFATRHLVDRFGVKVRDERRRRVARSVWDIQDVDGFVSAARRRPSKRRKPPVSPPKGPGAWLRQLLLFEK